MATDIPTTMLVDRAGTRSLHQQITERVLELVSHLEIGVAVPTEQQLMETYSVSRTTVRKAVDTLVEQGVLVRRHGRGTFVADHGVQHSLDALSPFFSVLEAAGRAPETRVVWFGRLTGDDLPRPLADVGSTALGYRRVYLTDAVPHAVLDVRVAERFADGITEADVAETPILHLLQARHHLTIRDASYTVRAVPCPVDVAGLLGLEAGASVLVLDRCTRTTAGQLTELTTHYLDPSIYSMTVEVGAGSSRGAIGLSARADLEAGA